MTLSYDLLRAVCARKGYWFPTSGVRYDLFLFGVRSAAPPDSDRFDDLVGAAYPGDQGHPTIELWSATTDPGQAALRTASNPNGCATLIPGQYRAFWTLGEHHPGTAGAYPCLVPTEAWEGRIPVYRGTDRTTIYRDGSQIQLHHAGYASQIVGLWSGGCQALQRAQDLARVLALVRLQAQAGLGDEVSYTLLTASDLG